jgi:hypothetical protein
VTQQNGNTLDWNSREKQFHCERVTEPILMSAWNVRQFEEFAQTCLPAAYNAFEFAVATPEQRLFCNVWRRVKRGENEFRKDGVHWHAGFLCVEEQAVTLELVRAEVHRI